MQVYVSLKQKYHPFIEGMCIVLTATCCLPGGKAEEGEPLLEQTFSWPILYISTLLQCVWTQCNSSLFTCLCAPE